MTARPAFVTAGAALLLTLLTLALGAGAASAGTWIQVSCVNPNGSPAPSEGWSAGSRGSPGNGSGSATRCAPGQPMYAVLSNLTPDPVGTSEYLQYTPPSSSKLIGGTVNVTLGAAGDGPSADAVAALYEPQFVWPSDVFGECTHLQPCQNGAFQFSGSVPLPSDQGGDLYLDAQCGGASGGTCNASTGGQPWAVVDVSSAQFQLSTPATPAASGFTGTALDARLRGTPHLIFTATDPGPGVYLITVALDGQTVWSGTPNTNGGACVPVGSSGGALEFDSQQPCPASENVEAPVPTAGLPDGSHELSVQVTDAAGNSATVLDQEVTTSNPQVTPLPRGRRAIRARFTLSWAWSGAVTHLRALSIAGLPRSARLAVTCSGRGCPRLRVRHAGARQTRRLIDELRGRSFLAGDTLHLTVTARGRRAERIVVRFRPGQEPAAALMR